MKNKSPNSLLPPGLQREASGYMNGESPFAAGKQMAYEAKQRVTSQTKDLEGSLKTVLCGIIDGEAARIDAHRDTPESVVTRIIDRILASEENLKEFVRRVDQRWGSDNQERPYFERSGQPSHPDDPYTYQSVRTSLEALRQALQD